jgi:HD-like signal output (HDOD) protein
MKTDWKLVRELLNAAIDSCERLEQAGYAEEHRNRSVQIDGRQVSVQEFLISAWTLPENVRYEVIRARHDRNLDLPYVPETARILTAVAAACAELIGAGDMPPTELHMRGMIDWYRNHFDPHMQRAISAAP